MRPIARVQEAVEQRGRTKGQGAGGGARGRGQGGFKSASGSGTGQAVGMLNSSWAVKVRRAVEGR